MLKTHTERDTSCCCFLHWVFVLFVASIRFHCIRFAATHNHRNYFVSKSNLFTTNWLALSHASFHCFFFVFLPSVDRSLSPSISFCLSVPVISVTFIASIAKWYRHITLVVTFIYFRALPFVDPQFMSCAMICCSVNSQFHSITLYNRTILVNFLWFQQAQFLCFFSPFPSFCAVLISRRFSLNSMMGESGKNTTEWYSEKGRSMCVPILQ